MATGSLSLKQKAVASALRIVHLNRWKHRDSRWTRIFHLGFALS
jgi:hypothetical protein